MAENGEECPRCGYDLSGARAAWPEDRCPIKVKCSECALDTLWRDLLNPAYRVLDRSFEGARRRVVGAFFTTWWRSLRPRTFWRWTQMHNEPRAGRLLVFLPLVLLGAWLLGTVIEFVGKVTFYLANVGAGPWAGSPTISEVVYIAEFSAVPSWLRWGWGWNTPILAGILAVMAGLALMPMTFLLVPQTLKACKVRTIHLIRVGVYTTSLPITMLFAVPAVLAVIDEWIWSGWTFSRWLFQMFHPVTVCMTLLGMWLLVSWTCAARSYLRLPHALGVVAAMIAISILLVLAIGTVFMLVSKDVLAWVFGFSV